jgi:ketosteroid isomerase-like protein
MDNEELEIRSDIANRLRNSNSILWSKLSPKQRDAAVDKYFNMNSIENVGLNKVLDDNRNTRRAFGGILVGLLLGLLGSITGTILLDYLPTEKLGKLIHLINFSVVFLFGFIVWKFVKMIDEDSAEHLRQEKVLEYLVGGKSAHSPNIQLVLDILKNEADGDVAAALEKMTEDYSMTWMYQKNNELFPTTGRDMKAELEEVYPIKSREYDIRNITESENVVMIEMIESYPDPETGQMYRTPQVIVLELEHGKIKTGRHYCDPRLSYLELSKEDINKALKGTASKHIIS